MSYMQIADKFNKDGRDGLSEASKKQSAIHQANESLKSADKARKSSGMATGAGLGAAIAVGGGAGMVGVAAGGGLGLAVGYLAYEYL